MILADTFTDTNGTAIASHTPEKGGAWTKHTNSTPSPTVQSNGLVSSTSGAAWAHSAATPPGANQEHSFVLEMGTAVNEVGVCCRMDTSATTFYDVRYEAASGQFELFKTVAGSETSLGTFAFANVPGAKAYVTLNCTDDAKQAFVNGDLAIESTDNAITATGKLGVRTKGNDTAGCKLGRVWASNSYSTVIDGFNNGTANAVISDRAGALRGLWVKHSASSTTEFQLGGITGLDQRGQLPGGSAFPSSTATGYYYVAAPPSGVDYDVGAVLLQGEATPTSQVSLAGVVARLLTTSPVGYYGIRYDASNFFYELIKVVSGVKTQFATFNQTNVSGDMHHVLLEILGSTLNMWIDGVLQGTGTDSDAALVGAGRAGLLLRSGTGSAFSSHIRSTLFHFAATIGDTSGPNTPTLSSVTAKVAAAAVAWTAVVDVGAAGLKGYRVEYRLTGGSGLWTDSGAIYTTTSSTVSSLPTGASLDFRVRAIDNYGNLSVASNVIAATPTAGSDPPGPYNDITGTHSGSVTVNQASLTVDPAGKSVDYAGGKTTFADDPTFDVGAVCTLRAIVRPDTIPSGGTRRALIDRSGAYSLKMNGSSLEGTVIIGTVAKTATASSVFVAATTVDVAVTYDGANVQCYKNGVVAGAAVPATGSVDAAATAIIVGDATAGSQTFDGKIQQPEVLAEALAADRLVQDALALA